MSLFKQLFKSDFIKNSSILIMGTVLAQLIPILAQPFIRRVYTDAETGRLDLYMSFVAILASFVHLNYAKTIVIPKSEQSASNLLAGSVVSSFVVSFFILIIFLLFGESILIFFNLPIAFLPWMKFIPFSIFLIGSYNSITFWLTRQKKFKAIALNKFSRRTGEAGTQILAKNISSNGLIIGVIVGDIINLFSNLIQLKNTSFSFNNLSFQKIKSEFKNYKDFPIYSLLPTVLNTLSSNLPVIMITSFFSDKIAGQFGLSRMVLAIPLALISVSISQVLLQKVAEKRQNNENVKLLMRNVLFFLGGISIIGTIIIYFFSSPLFNMAFGGKWELAATLSQTLIFYFSISFIATPISVIFIAFEEVKINSIWQTMHFLAIASLYFFQHLPILEFIQTFTIINIISYSIYISLTYYIIKKYHQSILK
ncbi:MAG: oligosaccharide flippase family protein [Flavobacteriales bacterium]|jgi:O-antigen/teichoic acid export membrane protein|nr:oligosaccharide flippase family protein [Flavobacteriales bacterium]